ncbi:N-acetylmuramoyl-L-alanine amidase family protein [Anaerotardibacter muris]|uniref:N-acetylmuramoyl-L-alanine amidase family protein n=1 Tax=Anaerotardibacter muris TaxID=2941505 RepID=UPI002040F0B1|nr:transglutaminase domain-containing protein [Anaerotardibacter muris]
MNGFQNMISGKTAELSSSKFIKAAIAVLLSLALAITPGLAFATEGGMVKEDSVQEQVDQTTSAAEESSIEQGSVSQEADAAVAEAGEVDVATGISTEATLGSENAESASSADSEAAVASEGDQASIEAQSITTQSGEGGTFVGADHAPEHSGNASMPISVEANFSVDGDAVLVKFELGITTGPNTVTSKDYTFKIDGIDLKINGAYTPEIEGYNTFLPAADYGINGKASQWYRLKAAGDYRVRVTARKNGSSAESYVNAYFRITSGTNVSTLDAKIQAIADECKKRTNLYEKVLYAHDYIINTLKVKEASNTRYVGATAVLFYETGTSQSFAQAMNLILSKAGVNNRVVTADGRSWNLVTVDGGQNMHVDVAADSSRDANWNHLFFGVTDAQMKKLHSGFSPISGMTATNYKLNYYMAKSGVTNAMPTWSASLKSTIANQVRSGKISFELTAANYVGNALKTDPATYIIMCDNAAKYLAEASNSSPSSFGGKAVLIDLSYNATPQKSVYKVSIKSLNSPLLVISDLRASYDANGKAQTPVPTLTLNGTRLKNGTDFTITYSNNVNPGTATMVIKGKGSYSGSITKTFKINSTPQYPIKVTGKWVKSGSRWWFSYDATTKKAQNKSWPSNEWAMINGKRYYFDGSGWMKANWLQLNSKWYWLGSDGAMKTGWKKIKGTWYYMASDGVMQNTKQTIGGKTYNFKSSGAMITGWSKEGTGWWYYTSSGAMKTGWQKLKGKWYYLDPSDNGRMRTGWLTTGGQTYWLQGSGAMITGWGELAGNWYYFNKSGYMQKNKWISGKYYVGSDGVMAKNTWVDNKWYVDGNGKWVATA